MRARNDQCRRDDSGIADDRLRLIFTCCHPALSLEARVALTLRTAGRAQHRRDRPGVPGAGGHDGQAPRPAKAKIQNAGIPYRVPPAHHAGGAARRRAQRPLPALQRRLRRQCRRRPGPPRALRRGDPAGPHPGRLMPDEPEVTAVLALMLLHHARRTARIDSHGDLVTLDEPGQVPVGPAQIAEGLTCWTRRCTADGTGPTDPGGHRRAATRPRSRQPTPTGPRSSGSTSSWHCSCRPQWCG